jgi:hypothetical protein
MKLTKFFEFKRGAFTPIKSFRLQDELPSKIWDDFELDEEVRKQLLQIGQDFYEGTEIKADVIDIVLCGSLCNYNWSERYSDYDLHITIDYKDIDEDYELVEKLCDYAKKIWNSQHDIKIKGYEVEVCIQDDSIMRDELKTGKMGGVYSLLHNKWVKKPVKVDFKPNERMIKEKSKTIMMFIDDIEEESKEKEFDELEPEIKKIWKKIKTYRQSGLDSESGEFSLGNLVFKLLRRNGYIGKVMALKRKLYDKQFK